MNMNGYEHSMKMDETAKNGRTLKDLNLTDDFLFDITTENLENCKYIIELSLGIELKALRWKENQKVIHNIPGKRGIRMDFIAESISGELFDVEMQKRNEGNIPKRTRFYQALNDAPMLKSGERGFDKRRSLLRSPSFKNILLFMLFYLCSNIHGSQFRSHVSYPYPPNVPVHLPDAFPLLLLSR